MKLRPVGAVVLSVLVLAPGVSLVMRQRIPATREAKLRIALPSVARSFSFRAQPFGERGESFIRDPFLRETDDAPYDRELRDLLSANQVLAAEKVKRTDAAKDVMKAKEEIREIQDRLDRAQFIGMFGFDASAERVNQDKALLQLWIQRLTTRQNALNDAERAVIHVESTATAIEARLKPMGSAHATEGLLIERNGLLVLFYDRTPVEKIVEVLKHHQLVGSEVGTSGVLFFARSADGEGPPTDAGEAARLRGIAANLEEMEKQVVLSAMVNAVLGGTSVPRVIKPNARDWFGGTDPLAISRFPGAWNFNDAIRRRPSGRVAVGVIDLGFDQTSNKFPDLSLTTLAPKGERPDLGAHGYKVAAVIGAGFDDSQLVDGAAPFTKMYGCSAFPKKVEGQTDEQIEFDRIGNTMKNFIDCLDRLANLPVAVINASVGYNWRGHHRIRPHLKPVGPPRTDAERRAELAQKTVERHGEMVRTSLRAASSKLIIVSAAGNDSRDPAVWSSPFNWAALGTSSKGTSPAENVIVVEGLEATGKARASLSNMGGMIQAISESIPTLIIENDKEKLASCPQGTSCAAPLVTAAVAQMLGLDPQLAPDAVKANLDITDPKNPQPLNAYQAVRAAATDADLANYSTDALGNNIDDQVVDMKDFEVFRADFKGLADARATGVFNVDLNRDGETNANDAFFWRSDFDDNGTIDDADLEVMINAWTDTSIPRPTLRATLRARLRQ